MLIVAIGWLFVVLIFAGVQLVSPQGSLLVALLLVLRRRAAAGRGAVRDGRAGAAAGARRAERAAARQPRIQTPAAMRPGDAVAPEREEA